MENSSRRRLELSLLLCTVILLSGCTPAQPKDTANICKIFKEYPSWYWDAKKAQKRWGMPVNVQMAIIYQESRFNGKAKPPRTKLLWVIPWTRPTSAYGYAQALDSTWDSYKKATGKHFVGRNDFGDATDFIAWYGYNARKRAGISLWNAYAQYLAFHEGVGGYMRGTYRHKQWLINVAHKVERRSRIFSYQLRRCQGSIKKPWF